MGHNQPGSNPPPLPHLPRSNVATPSFTVAPVLPSIPLPLGHTLGIVPTGTNTMVTSSGPNSARPLSSTQQLHTPSAAPSQGTIALDQVSQMMGDMLSHFEVKMLNKVTNMVESRSAPGTRPCNVAPNYPHIRTPPRYIRNTRRKSSNVATGQPHDIGRMNPMAPPWKTTRSN